MTYDAENTSVESGKPIDLITFAVGADNYRFTNAEDELTVLAQTYEPIAITRDVVKYGREARTQLIGVRLPADHVFAQRFENRPIGTNISCVIRTIHRDDLTDPRIEFSGIVRSTGRDGLGHEVQFYLLPLTGSLLRPVPSRVFSRQCNHVLYDSGCGVNPASHQYTGVAATTADPRIITVSGIDSSEGVGWATGGYVEFNGDFRGVFSHVATDTLVLAVPFKDDVGGESVDVFAGCDHNFDGDCSATKFNNQDRYNGFPYIPTKNPFRGRINR